MKGLIFWSSLVGSFMIMIPVTCYGSLALFFGVLIPLALVVAWIWTELFFNDYFWR